MGLRDVFRSPPPHPRPHSSFPLRCPRTWCVTRCYPTAVPPTAKYRRVCGTFNNNASFVYTRTSPNTNYRFEKRPFSFKLHKWKLYYNIHRRNGRTHVHIFIHVKIRHLVITGSTRSLILSLYTASSRPSPASVCECVCDFSGIYIFNFFFFFVHPACVRSLAFKKRKKKIKIYNTTIAGLQSIPKRILNALARAHAHKQTDAQTYINII